MRRARTHAFGSSKAARDQSPSPSPQALKYSLREHDPGDHAQGGRSNVQRRRPALALARRGPHHHRQRQRNPEHSDDRTDSERREVGDSRSRIRSGRDEQGRDRAAAGEAMRDAEAERATRVDRRVLVSMGFITRMTVEVDMRDTRYGIRDAYLASRISHLVSVRMHVPAPTDIPPDHDRTEENEEGGH